MFISSQHTKISWTCNFLEFETLPTFMGHIVYTYLAIWDASPCLHIVKKMVICLGTLSHYFGNFCNAMMKTKKKSWKIQSKSINSFDLENV